MPVEKFTKFVGLCNKIWDTTAGDTASDKINQRTYNILKEFADTVMQNIVINMDNTNNQDVKDGVETITELIEDGTTNVSNGTNYI